MGSKRRKYLLMSRKDCYCYMQRQLGCLFWSSLTAICYWFLEEMLMLPRDMFNFCSVILILFALFCNKPILSFLHLLCQSFSNTVCDSCSVQSFLIKLYQLKVCRFSGKDEKIRFLPYILYLFRPAKRMIWKIGI